jgi:hypothetical protein
VLVVHHVVVDVLVVGPTAHLARADAKVVVKGVIVVVDVVVVVVVMVVMVVVVVVVVLVRVDVVIVVVAAQTAPHLATQHAQQTAEAHVVPHVPAVQAALTAHHVTQLAHRDAHHALEDVKDLVMSVVRVVVIQIAQLLVKTHVLRIVQQHAFQHARQRLGLVL